MFFGDKQIEIYQRGPDKELGGGVSAPGELSLLGRPYVDVQPYSSAEARKDYGFDIDTTNTVFTDTQLEITIGKTVIKYNGSEYDVVEKIVWDDYTEVIINRRK